MQNGNNPEEDTGNGDKSFFTHGFLPIRHQFDNVLNDIQNSAGAAVQSNNMLTKNDPAPDLRNRGQSLLQLNGKQL
jgi:hypothetical protein